MSKAKRYASILALLVTTQAADGDSLGAIRELHVGIPVEKQSCTLVGSEAASLGKTVGGGLMGGVAGGALGSLIGGKKGAGIGAALGAGGGYRFGVRGFTSSGDDTSDSKPYVRVVAFDLLGPIA